MKKTAVFHSLVGKVLSPALALLIFTQCTEEAKIESPAPAAPVETVSNEGDEPVMSLTIDGIHTTISSVEDCKTCNYVVPEDASVVDGKELGIKAGQIICLDRTYKYGNLKLINLEGEEDKPIVIAYSVKDISAISEK